MTQQHLYGGATFHGARATDAADPVDPGDLVTLRHLAKGGGGPTFGAVTVDVGPLPTPEFTTTVDVQAATAGAFAQAWLSHLAPGKDDDEVAADVIDVWAYVPTAGKLTIRLTGQTGFIHDRFTVHYLLRSST